MTNFIGSMMKINTLLFFIIISTVAIASEKTVEITPEALRPAIEHYLEDKGDFCLGKFDWPITVNQHDMQVDSRNAMQMPVLERIGLVVSSDGLEKWEESGTEKMVPVKIYALTQAGRKFYQDRETSIPRPDGTRLTHRQDLCAGKLSLDTIAHIDSYKLSSGEQQAIVTYTYKIAAADWAYDPGVQKVFPMLDRVLNGEGKIQLQQTFQLANNSWVAVNMW